MLAGDIITEIDGDAVQGMTLNQAVDKMRGAVNSRGQAEDRARAEQGSAGHQASSAPSSRSSRSATHAEDDVGYIRITQFNEQTYDGLKEAHRQASAEIPADKLKGYILDLRNNPGGLLDQSI